MLWGREGWARLSRTEDIKIEPLFLSALSGMRRDTFRGNEFPFTGLYVVNFPWNHTPLFLCVGSNSHPVFGHVFLIWNSRHIGFPRRQVGDGNLQN